MKRLQCTIHALTGVLLILGMGMLANAPTSNATQVPGNGGPARKYHRGLKLAPPEVVKARHDAAFGRHGFRMKALPKATPASYDCRTLGFVQTIQDQGQCGSCYEVSSVDCITCAFVKAGGLTLSQGPLAAQYGMDCHTDWGGCNGGDEAQVIEWGKTGGFPLQSAYGLYTASAGNCKQNAGQMYKIADWGYCAKDQGQGIASTQAMKDAIVAYGVISVAFDASGCDGYNSGVMRGRGNNVDHAVTCVGWETDSQTGKTNFIGRNQWGTSFGENGYFRIEEGSYSWGTEAIWVTVTGLPPPPPDPPPGPTPPPGPGPTPIPGTVPVGSDLAGYEIVPIGTMSKLDQIRTLVNGPSPTPPGPGPSPEPPLAGPKIFVTVIYADGAKPTIVDSDALKAAIAKGGHDFNAFAFSDSRVTSLGFKKELDLSKLPVLIMQSKDGTVLPAKKAYALPGDVKGVMDAVHAAQQVVKP